MVVGKIGKSRSSVNEGSLESAPTADLNMNPHTPKKSNVSPVHRGDDAQKSVPMNAVVARITASTQSRATRRGSRLRQNRAAPQHGITVRTHECVGDCDLKRTSRELRISTT